MQYGAVCRIDEARWHARACAATVHEPILKLFVKKISQLSIPHYILLCHVGTTMAISRVQMCADNVQAIKKLRLYKVIE